MFDPIKGARVYFVTQNPADVPEDILGQLGNRVQHALRAYTSKDQRALRLTAESYRDNPPTLRHKKHFTGGCGRGGDVVP